jgi:PAS domain S-box-containing protein
MDPIFVKGFVDAGLYAFNLHFEFMDLAKHPDPAHRRELVKSLGRKFEKRPIDLIIALHHTALSFLVEEGRDLFPGVPVINAIAHPEFFNEDFRSAYERRLRPLKRPFVILPYAANVDSTMESILRLRPDTRGLAVISGSSFLDRMMDQMVRRSVQAWQGRLSIEYFDALPLEEVLKRVATLAPGTAILFANFSADPDGKAYSPPEVVQRISRAANAPVFGLFDTILGNMGIVGGIMQNHRNEAGRTVRLALEILRGRLPTDPVTISPAPFIPMFDWEQLKRWGMKENRLPPGSIVLNRPRTLWSENKGLIIGGIAVLLAQASLLIGLLIQRNLRRRAESSVRQKAAELDQFFDVSLDLLCIANTDGYFLRLNPAWERTLGYSHEELMAKRFLDFIHPDDIDRTREAISTLSSQQKVFSFENRYRCKDGTYRWLQWSSAPAGKLIYAAAREVTERRQTEKELSESEERLRLVLEANSEGVWDWNIPSGHAVFSPRYSGMLGYTPEEFAKSYASWKDLVHPDDFERVNKAHADHIHGGKEFCVELRMRKKSGEWCWILSRGMVVERDVEGKAIRMVGTHLDITERKRTEEALRQSDERLRVLIEESTMAIGISREGVITYVNKKYLEMFGYESGDEIHGQSVLTQWATEDRQEIMDRMRCQERGLSVPPEIQGIGLRKDGSKLNLHVAITNLELKDGPASIVFFTDITERKRAEEALKQSEEKFRQVAENVGDFIWEVDLNGLYCYTSPSVEKILGYRPDELVGKRHFYDLFALEVREGLKAAAFKVFAAKESLRAFPNPNISKEGKVVHLETSGSPLLDAAGNLVGYRGADTDVTERKWAEEELRRHQEHLEELVRERTAELIAARDQAEVANRAKSTFLANMSHELRTPLNSILGIAQLMERDAGFPGQHRDTLKILSHSGTHLLDLINDLLEISKMEAGKMVPVITSFDLHSFLGDLEEMTRLRADQKGLKLRFEYESHLPQYIETDVRKLRQILVNLLGNAIKYTEKGHVTLRVAFKEGMDTTPEAMPLCLGRLEFEIEDTGIGMAPEDTQRIFDPFVQLDPGLTARDGTGLGLTLTRMFVELLDGEITLRSQVGKGSTFVFCIAVKRAEGAAIHTQKADRQVIGLMRGHPPYRLLVVDDSVENRFVLRRLLEQSGFSVLEAASGQEAVDLYKSGQPDLIWMDLRMPAMDGFEAARRIREAESGRRDEEGKETHTPIIALTAGVMEDERPSSHSEVFDGWVYKPFRETEVFEQLEKHLGVQFVYQPSVGSAGEGSTLRDKSALTPADLSTLPAIWLKEFLQALKKGRSAPLFNMIDQIRPEHADLAHSLAELVHIYRFDKLIAVTAEVLKENSNA